MKDKEMGQGIQIPCPACDGKGVLRVYAPPPLNEWLREFSECGTCNGFKVLIATELKAVTKVEPLSRDPRESNER
jgi:hypothetical protein